MGQTLDNKALVIGVASSALFDLGESDQIFREEGVEAYERYQNEHLDEPFRPGVAFPFISKLLEFNSVFDGDDQGVEVVVLSRNSPRTGLRVMNSIEHYGLDITRSVFRSGISPFEYMKAFDMALFLSADDADVREAVAEGFPAGCVLPLSDSGNRGDGTAAEATHVHESGEELRVAFDFDGVLAGDSAERVFREAQVSDPANALEKYNEHEADLANRPIEEGPLKRLLEGINILQNAAREYREANPAAQTPNLRVALVTARSGKGAETSREHVGGLGVDGRRRVLPRRPEQGALPQPHAARHLLRRPDGQSRPVHALHTLGAHPVRRAQRGIGRRPGG